MPLGELVHRHRPAAGEPAGALVLLHGRGVDENDLYPLLDVLDPARRLAGFTPRAPLRPPGHTGNHWYVVERVGYPHRETFAESHERLGRWLEAVGGATGVGPERIVLAGFSQGGVMAYAGGLGAGRPVPAAIVAMSCFVPSVAGWEPELAGRAGLPVHHSHGIADPVIPVELGRAARELLEGRVSLTYREHPGGHTIDPRGFDELSGFIAEALSRPLPGA